MSNLPSLSIITVCKNAAAGIAATIESVLSQKMGGIEYLVVDGVSSDETIEIVRSYGDKVDFVISEADNGIAEAFNKGITRARGEIVGLLNADDLLLPGTLGKVCDYFANHPDVDVLHADVMLCRGKYGIKRVKPAGRWWYPWRLVLFNHPATFVRRRVYEQHGLFDMSYEIAMDVEIFLRWMRKGVHIAYLPEVTVAMQSGGVSGRRAFDGYREVRRALGAHRFPAIPAVIQYIARYGVQAVVCLREKLGLLKRVT